MSNYISYQQDTVWVDNQPCDDVLYVVDFEALIDEEREQGMDIEVHAGGWVFDPAPEQVGILARMTGG